MIHIRVVYRNLWGPCGLHTWVRESEINVLLESKEIPRDAVVWIDKGDYYERYTGYQLDQTA